MNSYEPPVNIIGCACTGGLLDRLLVNENFHLIITALSGSFEVTRVVVVAYDDDNGYGNSTTATGVISSFSIPEPGTLALFGLGLAGIGAMRRKKLV